MQHSVYPTTGQQQKRRLSNTHRRHAEPNRTEPSRNLPPWPSARTWRWPSPRRRNLLDFWLTALRTRGLNKTSPVAENQNTKTTHGRHEDTMTHPANPLTTIAYCPNRSEIRSGVHAQTAITRHDLNSFRIAPTPFGFIALLQVSAGSFLHYSTRGPTTPWPSEPSTWQNSGATNGSGHTSRMR